MPTLPELGLRAGGQWTLEKVVTTVELSEGSMGRFFKVLLLETDPLSIELDAETANAQLAQRLRDATCVDLMRSIPCCPLDVASTTSTLLSSLLTCVFSHVLFHMTHNKLVSVAIWSTLAFFHSVYALVSQPMTDL